MPNADSSCSRGRKSAPNLENCMSACCPARCARCGGKQCYGGCCAVKIFTHNVSCESRGPPCVVTEITGVCKSSLEWAHNVIRLLKHTPALVLEASTHNTDATVNSRPVEALVITSALKFDGSCQALDALGYKHTFRVQPVYTDTPCVTYKLVLHQTPCPHSAQLNAVERRRGGGSTIALPSNRRRCKNDCEPSVQRTAALPDGAVFFLNSQQQPSMYESLGASGIFKAHWKAWSIVARLPSSAPPVLIVESDWSIGNKSNESLREQLRRHANSDADFVALGWCKQVHHYFRQGQASGPPQPIPLCLTAYTLTPTAASWLVNIVPKCSHLKVPVDWVLSLLCAMGKMVCEFVHVPTMDGYFGFGYFQQDRGTFIGLHNKHKIKPETAPAGQVMDRNSILKNRRTEPPTNSCPSAFERGYNALSQIHRMFALRNATSPRRLIICAGEGSTGTRSLQQLFEDIGLRTMHYPNVPLQLLNASADNYETLPYVELFKKFDVILDSPVPQLLPFILAAFPDALVIHTFRDISAWVKTRQLYSGPPLAKIAASRPWAFLFDAAFPRKPVFGMDGSVTTLDLIGYSTYNLMVKCSVPPKRYMALDLTRGDACQPGFIRRMLRFIGKKHITQSIHKLGNMWCKINTG